MSLKYKNDIKCINVPLSENESPSQKAGKSQQNLRVLKFTYSYDGSMTKVHFLHEDWFIRVLHFDVRNEKILRNAVEKIRGAEKIAINECFDFRYDSERNTFLAIFSCGNELLLGSFSYSHKKEEFVFEEKYLIAEKRLIKENIKKL